MESRTFRVLLYAHVDLNVIDGSAFFVAGAASLLTSAPGVAVDVITATPIRRPVVVHEMLVNDRVSVTDPFRDQTLAARLPEFRGATRMNEGTAARVLDHYLDQGRHDVVVVRSTEVAHALAELRPSLGRRLCVYVTGVVAADVEVEAGLRGRLQSLLDGGATLLCQTPEMREHLARSLDVDRAPGALALMSPAVPPESDAVLPGARGPLVLAYTGKFAPAWHTVEMLAGFKEAASAGADLQLVVAGDHFKRPEEWPTFGAEVRYLLGSHPGISWVGAVTRADARALVAGADVGLGWRHASLDSSLELSTKLLEHGVLGRPCVINPTTMHERLFGADYPLYARSTTDFVGLLGRMAADRGLVRAAAETAMAVAADYTYDKVFHDVFPTLVEAATAAEGLARGGMSRGVAALLAGPERLVQHEGWWVGWLAGDHDAARILAHVGATASLGDIERLGPFVRWRLANDDGHDGSVPALELLTAVLHGLRDQRVPQPLTNGEPTVAHDAGGRVRLAAPAPTLGDAEAAAETARLAALVRQHEKDAARAAARYDALAGSRLGRLQRAYWRLRSRLRTRGHGTAS